MRRLIMMAVVVLGLVPALARAAGPAPLPVATPTPVSGVSGLSTVACGSATSCVALGTTSSGAVATVSIVNGIASRPVSVPSVPAADQLTLNAIACGSATACDAVGSLVDGDGNTSAVVVPVVRGMPGAPRTATDSEAADGDAPSLTAVACATAVSCEGVGEGNDAVATQIRNGTPSALAHDTDPEIAQLTGVACAGNACDALGSGSDGTGVIVPVSGGNLGATQEVNGTASLTSAGCVAGATTCEVLGTDDNGNGLLVPDAHGAFGAPARVPSDNGLTSIACPTTSMCEAVGTSAANGSGVLVPVVRGAAQSPTTIPFGSGTVVACASSTSCLLAGTLSDGSAAVAQLGGAVDAIAVNVGGARVHGTTVTVPVTCADACAGQVTETASSRGRRITIGHSAFSLRAGAARAVSVRLNAAGRRLLARTPPLHAELTVSTTGTSGRAAVAAIRTATIGHAKRPVRRRRPRR